MRADETTASGPAYPAEPEADDAPARPPVVSYVGYSLEEPWGKARIVIGLDADEAGFLAEFLDRDECAHPAQDRFSPVG